jgi:hypothetical protein
MAPRRAAFDPRAILAALQRHRVDYVLIGGLAQVLRGVDHITDGVDICPSFGTGNLERLAGAAAELHARRPDGSPVVVSEEALAAEPVVSLVTDGGVLQVVASPEGAPKGYVDLRRAATKEHLGHGVQPLVASAADLARLAAALHRDEDLARLTQLRRVVELEAGLQPPMAPVTEPVSPRSRRSAARGLRPRR